MKAKHAHPTPAANRVGRALSVPLVVATALAGAASPAMAAKGGGGGSGPAAGGGAACSVTPNPVSVNTDYTLKATGLGAGAIVNEIVTDASGAMKAWQLQADASGTTSVVGHAYWAGQSDVTIQQQSHHGWSTLASCSFTVS